MSLARNIRVVGLVALSIAFATPALPQQASVWTSSETPSSAQATNDTAAVNIGLKFNSDVAGSVVAVRFFKGPNNIGPHTVDVWSGSGQKLAETKTSTESSTGWQQANLPTPVHIAAKTDYVVSYLAAKGNYALDKGYQWSSRNSPPLHPSGGNPGVFTYASSTAFPSSTWNSSNYWVDLLFMPDAGSPGNGSGTTYTLSGKVTGPKTNLTLSGAAAGSASTDASGNYTFPSLKNGSYLVVPSATGYSYSPSSASVSINGQNATGIVFVGTATPVSTSHTVALSWNGSASLNIRGYRVYRSSLHGGPYSLMTSSLLTNMSYMDSTVDAGKTYLLCFDRGRQH